MSLSSRYATLATVGLLALLNTYAAPTTTENSVTKQNTAVTSPVVRLQQNSTARENNLTYDSCPRSSYNIENIVVKQTNTPNDKSLTADLFGPILKPRAYNRAEKSQDESLTADLFYPILRGKRYTKPDAQNGESQTADLFEPILKPKNLVDANTPREDQLVADLFWPILKPRNTYAVAQTPQEIALTADLFGPILKPRNIK